MKYVPFAINTCQWLLIIIRCSKIQSFSLDVWQNINYFTDKLLFIAVNGYKYHFEYTKWLQVWLLQWLQVSFCTLESLYITYFSLTYEIYNITLQIFISLQTRECILQYEKRHIYRWPEYSLPENSPRKVPPRLFPPRNIPHHEY